MLFNLAIFFSLFEASTGFVLTHKNVPTSDPTESPVYKPCKGQIIVSLDISKDLTDTQFDNQRNLIAKKLFNSDNFNHYERLSIGYYGKFPKLELFGTFTNAKDVEDYVEHIKKSSTDSANLRRALNALLDLDLPSDSSNPLTAIYFVSSIQEQQVEDSREIAEKIQAKGIRLVLIAHGNSVDVNLLAKITGDASLVFKWNVNDAEPSNYIEWFKQIIACPSK